MSEILDAIASWENRASQSEARYFFTPADLEADIEALTTGGKCFVVGAKGAGKSAVLQHIREAARENDIFVESRFSPRNLREFCVRTANAAVQGDDLQLLWTYFICAKVCLKLAEKRLGPLRRFDLDSKYGLSHQRSWWQKLWRIMPKFRRVVVNAKGLEFETIEAPVDGKKEPGLELPVPRVPGSRDFLWAVNSDLAIEDAIVSQRVAKVRIFVFFDEIDVAFSQARDQQTFEEYLATVGALISSVHSLRTRLNSEHAEIYPIVAVRSDIYSYVSHADKSALNSRVVTLAYKDEQQLRPLIAHRISTALENNGAPAVTTDFERIWKKAVNETQDIRSPTSIYSYISKRTLNRPRDYVQYLRLAAIQQKKMRPLRKLISQQAVNIAGTEFSAFFLQEFRCVFF